MENLINLSAPNKDIENENAPNLSYKEIMNNKKDKKEEKINYDLIFQYWYQFRQHSYNILLSHKNYTTRFTDKTKETIKLISKTRKPVINNPEQINVNEKKIYNNNLILPLIKQKGIIKNKDKYDISIPKLIKRNKIINQKENKKNDSNIINPLYKYGKKFLMLGSVYKDIIQNLTKRGWTQINEGDK